MTAGKSSNFTQQFILLGLLLFEILIFSIVGTHFFTPENLLQIVRVSTELGLVSLAMTAVITTGGIDLSVGSMLGLSAVIFGKLWQDHHFPWPIAALVCLLVGTVGGAVNAATITRLKIHPLIVTLATFSLFRGIANGLTGGVENFTGFPASFLWLGNHQFGPVPVQLPILILASIGFYLLLHRSVMGRSWSVIGYAPEGARYAGIPVQWRTAVPYILSGLMASVAALIFAARYQQVKSDAGTDYELLAITAVVLGGTSIFGGRGTVLGTLLGLCTIAVLSNGLQMSMSDKGPQLAGILTSVLLLLATGLDHHLRRAKPARSVTEHVGEEPIMRNSQLAVLCTVILAAAVLVVAGNYVLLRPEKTKSTATEKSITVGMMPKDVGNAYFIACKKGATDAAGELGVKLLWDGPNGAQPGKQNEIVENWINRKVDVIAVSVDNADGLAPALERARSKGIKVITWDADTPRTPSARDFFVNQATAQGIGTALMDNTAAALGGKGKFAIITASLTAANQNEWIKYIEKRRAEKYPDIPAPVIQPCDDQPKQAFDQAKSIMNSDPEVKVLLAISSVAVPTAAEAVKQSGRTDVHVVGLGLPNENKKYVHEGITPAVILWNTMDLGYLTIYTAQAVSDGTLKPGSTSLNAGRLGQVKVEGDSVMLGVPFVFTKDNIDQFDF
jgi:rhamnose transport system permease protein